MFRLALASVFARRARLVLTSFAVVLGTSFLSGTLVLADTLDRTFDRLFTDIYDDVDVYVRSTEVTEAGFGREVRGPVDAELAEQLRSVAGVADAGVEVQGFARLLAADNTPVGSDGPGPPTLGGVIADHRGSPWNLVTGRLPVAGEVAVDVETAALAGFTLGDIVRVVTVTGVHELRLVALAEYRDVRAPGGATFALFDSQSASKLLRTAGGVDAVLVTGDGSVSQDALAATIDRVVAGRGLEVLTGAQITAEAQDRLARAIAFFATFLGIFSAVALAVGGFVIYNVLSIAAAQRRRENALLRALGADPRQVSAVLFAETLVVGLVGAAAGVVAGLGLARGLTALLGAFGVALPDGQLVLTGATVAATVTVGVAMTVAAGTLPALRAGKVPPLEALRASSLDAAVPPKTRSLLAAALLAIAAVALTTAGSGIRLGAGVVAAVAGVLVLGPLLVGPVVAALARPVAWGRKVPGVLAGLNARRNPKRSARTAAPVLVGVALVTAVATLAASVTAEVRSAVTGQFAGDFVVTTDAGPVGGLPTTLAAQVAALGSVDRATGFGFVRATVADDSTRLVALDPVGAAGLLDLGVVGPWSALTDASILVDADLIDTGVHALGEEVAVSFPGGVSAVLSVAGTFTDADLAGRYVVTSGLLDGLGVERFDLAVYVDAADPGDETFTAALTNLAASVGATVLTKEQFIERQVGAVDQLLGLVYGLLGLSVVVAAFGIVVSLLLSVHERRREIGLLRAVGALGVQVRTTVRWEGVLTALLGTVVGLVLGAVVGFAVIRALANSGLRSFALPVTSMAAIAVLAVVVALAAAAYPAHKAARTDILDAIAAE